MSKFEEGIALMKMMEPQCGHAQLPTMTCDETARQSFVQSYKLHLATKVAPMIKAIYANSLEPDFQRQHGRVPADRHEVAGLVDHHPYYRLWGALARTGQELCWNAVAEPVSRQARDLAAKAAARKDTKGTLELAPSLPIPNYLTAVDIHCMPGGYATESFDGDVGQGAIYDRGVHIYAMGGLGPKTDAAGRMTSQYLKDHFPDLRPKRILDLGCGVGHALLPYAEAFPGAEIHGIDVAAPMVRYAHSRAEAFGVGVHYKQMNAEALDYPDGYFDFVVSHILLHETSNSAVRRILRESRRVAAPGGVVAHLDMCFYSDMDPFNAFMLMWDTHNNNEPFWGGFRGMDGEALFTDAGFAAQNIFNVKISRNYDGQAVFSDGANDAGRGTWNLIGAVR